MKKLWEAWKSSPISARLALATLVAGWALHFMMYFSYFAADWQEKSNYLQLGVGIGICFAIASVSRWARMLCVFFNLGFVALYGLWSLGNFQSGESGGFALTALIALLFAASSVFLLRKETARFFTPASAPEESKR
jgi:hypothetical protein